MDKNGTHFFCTRIVVTASLALHYYNTTFTILHNNFCQKERVHAQTPPPNEKLFDIGAKKKKIETMSNFLPRPVLSGKGIYTFSSTLSGKQGTFIVQCTRCKDHTCALTKNELGVLTNHFTSNNVNFEMKLPVHKSSKKLVMPNPTTLPSSYLQCKKGMVPCIFCAAKRVAYSWPRCCRQKLPSRQGSAVGGGPEKESGKSTC